MSSRQARNIGRHRGGADEYARPTGPTRPTTNPTNANTRRRPGPGRRTSHGCSPWTRPPNDSGYDRRGYAAKPPHARSRARSSANTCGSPPPTSPPSSPPTSSPQSGESLANALRQRPTIREATWRPAPPRASIVTTMTTLRMGAARGLDRTTRHPLPGPLPQRRRHRRHRLRPPHPGRRPHPLQTSRHRPSHRHLPRPARRTDHPRRLGRNSGKKPTSPAPPAEPPAPATSATTSCPASDTSPCPASTGTPSNSSPNTSTPTCPTAPSPASCRCYPP